MQLRPLSLALLLGSFAVVAQAQDHRIDFDSLSSMDYVAGPSIPDSARLHDQFLNTLGVRFDSGAGYVAVVNLGPNHATSGTNGIGGATASGILTYSSQYPITLTFLNPLNAGEFAATDLVTVRGDLIGRNQPISTLRGYDAAGNLVATSTQADVGGQTYTLSSSVKNIHRVVFIGAPTDENGIALDDLGFNTVTPVPEPAGIVALGLGFVAALRRTRRR